MSNMLEQAIIDAEALKEAAIKNAENSLIEKYSDQIKEGKMEFACLPSEFLVSFSEFVPRGHEGRHENQWQQSAHLPMDVVEKGQVP